MNEYFQTPISGFGGQEGLTIVVLLLLGKNVADLLQKAQNHQHKQREAWSLATARANGKGEFAGARQPTPSANYLTQVCSDEISWAPRPPGLRSIAN